MASRPIQGADSNCVASLGHAPTGSNIEVLCKRDLVWLVACGLVALQGDLIGGFRADANSAAASGAHFGFQRSQNLQRDTPAPPSIFDENVGDVCMGAGVIAKKHIIVTLNP